MNENPDKSPPETDKDASPKTDELKGSMDQVALHAGFIALIVFIFRLFYSGHYWIGAAFFALFIAIASLCISKPWIKRISLSLSGPIAISCGCVGFLVYMQMFSFYWFRAIFNDKGTGPMGLVLFVVVFFSTSWIVAYQVIHGLLCRYFNHES